MPLNKPPVVRPSIVRGWLLEGTKEENRQGLRDLFAACDKGPRFVRIDQETMRNIERIDALKEELMGRKAPTVSVVVGLEPAQLDIWADSKCMHMMAEVGMLGSFIEGLNGPYSERLLKGTRGDVYTALETENKRLIALKKDDPELESWWSSDRYHRARAFQSEIDQIMKDKHEVLRLSGKSGNKVVVRLLDAKKERLDKKMEFNDRSSGSVEREEMSVEIRRFGELTRVFKRLIDAQGELEGAQAKLEELRVYLKPEIAVLRQRCDKVEEHVRSGNNNLRVADEQRTSARAREAVGRADLQKAVEEEARLSSVVPFLEMVKMYGDRPDVSVVPVLFPGCRHGGAWPAWIAPPPPGVPYLIADCRSCGLGGGTALNQAKVNSVMEEILPKVASIVVDNRMMLELEANDPALEV